MVFKRAFKRFYVHSKALSFIKNECRCIHINSHDEISSNSIRLFFYQQKLKFKEGWKCYECDHKIGNNNLNKPTIWYINIKNGNFVNIENNLSGPWELFKSIVCESENSKLVKELLRQAVTNTQSDEVTKRIYNTWKNSKNIASLEYDTVLKLLNKFTIDSRLHNQLIKYNIRCNDDFTSIIVPWFRYGHDIDLGETPEGLKIITDKRYAISEICHTSLFQTHPADTVNRYLFGINNVSPNAKSIVLTANEFDAMAINQDSKIFQAIALPKGSTYLGCGVLPCLERFSQVIMWFGNSSASWNSICNFSKELSTKRCRYIYDNDATSAMKVLGSGTGHIDSILKESSNFQATNILTFQNFEHDLKSELLGDKISSSVSGVPWQRFGELTKILKGHRLGELTILSGQTGCGKTTFLSEMSLDLCEQGVRTLWGSFEVRNYNLTKTMLKQFARIDLAANMNRYDEISREFEKLPMWFMNYRGEQKIEHVLETMRQAVIVNSVEHILLDNLQFMIDLSASSNSFQKLHEQDRAIGLLRKFATKENVHVTVVSHPRKEDTSMPLDISSIYGGVKTTQEADNVLIIQSLTRKYSSEYNQPRRCLDILKNRFDGHVGRVALNFDSHTKCMSHIEAVG